jgi:hypothetical protein
VASEVVLMKLRRLKAPAEGLRWDVMGKFYADGGADKTKNLKMSAYFYTPGGNGRSPKCRTGPLSSKKTSQV